MFETFEHTADLGLRVRAAELDDLFAEAGRGLFSVIVENLDAVRAEATQSIEIKSQSLEHLFFDWLTELLYRFDAQRWVFSRFDVFVTGTSLSATVAGEQIDRARHRFLREVKAITYHGLMVRQSSQHWEAEVIVDI